MIISILGHGVVGKGVWDMLQNRSEFTIRNVLVKKGEKTASFMVESFDEVLGDDSELVIECMGGVDPAFKFTSECLKAGKSLITSKLSYQVMVEKDGAQQVLPLTVACYPMLEQDMEEVPYNFEAKWDILLHGKMINLNQGEEEIKTWSKIGVRSIYRGGGEEHTSDIGWYDLEPFWQEMGIEQTTTAVEPADDAWYTVTGVRVAKPAAAGLYIHKGRKVVVR